MTPIGPDQRQASRNGTLAAMRRLVQVLLALALMASGCTDAGSGADLEVTDGLVQRFDGGQWSDTITVGPGDQIRSEAGARLERGDDRLWLLAGTEAVVGQDALTLSVGEAVVDGSDLAIALEDSTVEGIGAFRVASGVTPRVGVYTGTAQVERPGEIQRVSALRELDLSSRRFDGTDAPLSYDAGDPLDQQFLGRAIAFDVEVARYTTRLNELYGTGLQPPGFYALFAEVDDADVQVLTASAPNRDGRGLVGPAADALIGLFVARAVADGSEVGVAEAAERIAQLRAEGARWGLIAVSLDLGTVSFGATVDRAVAAGAAAAPAPAAAPAGPAAPPPAAPPPAPVPPAEEEPVPPTAPPPTAPPPPPAPPVPDGGPVGDLLDEVLPGASAMVGALLGT